MNHKTMRSMYDVDDPETKPDPLECLAVSFRAVLDLYKLQYQSAEDILYCLDNVEEPEFTRFDKHDRAELEHYLECFIVVWDMAQEASA